ncbi:MAG: M1 family aminopeptidase, partial [Myxococcaceae bacterium]
PAVPPSDAQGQPGAGPSGIGDLALYEPSNWLVSVTVPAGYQVHASGSALGEVPEPGGKVRFSFATAAARDFPLFVSKGYRVETAKVDDVVIESHFLPADAEAGKQVLRHAASVVAEYQRRLGPLPFKSFKVLEVHLTGGAGGMEFPGLVTISTALYRGAANPLSALGLPGLEALAGVGGLPLGADLGAKLQQVIELTVAHEVAHQYFAGLVGSDPVGFPVVDESLAQHTALLYMEWKHGKAAAERVRRSDLVGAYQLYRLSGGKDGPADRPTAEFDSGLEYGALIYGKAPLLHAEERKLLGDAAYLKGLRAYVDEYRFKWACRDCFTKLLSKHNPGQAKKLEALRRRWWDESHGDEDLGAPDLAGMMEGMTGTKLDPETAKLLEQLLPQLLGQ